MQQRAGGDTAIEETGLGGGGLAVGGDFGAKSSFSPLSLVLSRALRT
jgi:hypothetical protein